MGISEWAFIVTEYSSFDENGILAGYCVCSSLASVEWLLIKRQSFSDLLPADSPCCVNQQGDTEPVQITRV